VNIARREADYQSCGPKETSVKRAKQVCKWIKLNKRTYFEE
jgi:hypothetical protein